MVKDRASFASPMPPISQCEINFRRLVVSKGANLKVGIFFGDVVRVALDK
jgi:hypothetical protein